MNGSGYVTAYIAELNARLALLTGEKLDGPALALQEKALTYLHQSALKEYKNILKAQKEGVKFTGVSGSILQYLYIVAISGGQVPAANKAAYAYYLSKVKELLPTASMNAKAIAAIVLDKAGQKERSAGICCFSERTSDKDGRTGDVLRFQRESLCVGRNEDAGSCRRYGSFGIDRRKQRNGGRNETLAVETEADATMGFPL